MSGGISPQTGLSTTTGITIGKGITTGTGITQQSGGTPPFTPPSISGNVLWLDGADATTITQSSGNVSQWNDKSGSMNNAVQATGANQPIFNSHQINGKSTLTFNGTGSYLSLFSGISAASCTVFVVVQFNSTTASQAFLGSTSGLYFGRFGDNFLLYDGQTFNPITYSFSTGIGFVSYFTTATGNVNAFINNTQLIAGQPDTFISSINELGVAQVGVGFLDGQLGEIIVYNSALSPSDATKVLNYLYVKWGITVAAPSNYVTEDGLNNYTDESGNQLITE